MLKQLKISNFAIIDELLVEFNSGMSVITGETGAGKSILVDAIEQLLRQRACVQYIGPYRKAALIEAVFDIKQCKDIPIFKDNGIDCDDVLMISKEIEANGKAVIRINGQIKPFVFLKVLLSHVVHIHTQFEAYQSFKKEMTLDYVDGLAQIRNSEQYLEYFGYYQKYTELKKQYAELMNNKNQVNYIEHIELQLTELSDYLYSTEQIDEMIDQKRQATLFEKDAKRLKQAISLIEKNSILSNLYEAKHITSKVDDNLGVILNDIYYQLDDAMAMMYEKYKAMNFDSDRYESLASTLYEVKRLQKRYGYDLLKAHDELMLQYNVAKEIDYHLMKLQDNISVLETKMKSICIHINDLRFTTISKMEKVINLLFKDLYLKEAHLKVDVKECTEFCESGNLNLSFMVCMNKGHTYQPLAEVVSGGEFSRILLAMKVVMADVENVSLFVFDEIDSGVSGRVALAMAKMMRRLATSKQLLVITHLAQVASQAKYHYQVVKDTSSDTCSSKMILLNQNEHIEQIASMLSGDKVTQASRLQAKELIYG